MNPSDRKWLRSPSERVGTLSHADLPPPAPAAESDEQHLLRALRNRDEATFQWLLDHYYTPMLRLARTYVRSREDAEEAVQDAWLAVLRGIDTFQGRSSLKTWIFRILVNRARSRGKRQARQLPFTCLTPSTDDSGDLLVGTGSMTQGWGGQPWVPKGPDEILLADELYSRIETVISTLPPQQQQVITLRDLEGWSASEVCALLQLSEGNQRVLLHRARLKVRDALEGYFASPKVDPELRHIA